MWFLVYIYGHLYAQGHKPLSIETDKATVADFSQPGHSQADLKIYSARKYKREDHRIEKRERILLQCLNELQKNYCVKTKVIALDLDHSAK